MTWNEEAKTALKMVTSSFEYFQNKNEIFETSAKETFRDIVTKYDIEIENNIIKLLENSSYKIIGEETKFKTDGSIEDGIYWVIDPIDGTVNFVNRLHYCGIAIGLCQITRGSIIPLVGAFGMPETKEIFFMDGNKASYLNGKRLNKKDYNLIDSLVVASFSTKVRSKTSREKEYLTFGEINDSSRGVLRIGSATTAICYTSALRFQATYGLNIPIWDVITGLAIAQGADLESRIQFNFETMRVNFIIGSKRNVQEIHEILIRNGLWMI